MPAPAPPVPLKDHCSVIYNDTLYTYAPDAFQSLPLADGAEWDRLPLSVSVSGGTCLAAVPNGRDDEAAMYVVGGCANDTTVDYPGLQRYLFAKRQWESIRPSDLVTQNRKHHGATFIKSSSSLLIYAGSQDTVNATPSSQTFMISTKSPYTVTSYSSKAPPLVEPTLTQWNDTHAVMVGGGQGNKDVFTFSEDTGWTSLDLSLEGEVPGDAKTHPAVVEDDKGDKVLYTFDVSTSPNIVKRKILRQDQRPRLSRRTASIRSVRSIREHTSHQPPMKRQRRNPQGDSQPPSGTSLAPNTTRSGSSLAQSPNGLIVISGGNDRDPLMLYDGRTNQWVDTNSVFGSSITAQSRPDRTSTGTQSTSQIPTGSSTDAVGTPAPANNQSSTDRALTILGATLGAVFGFALLLVLIMFCVRWRRRKRLHEDAGHQRRASGLPPGEGGRLSFADRGASFMSQAQGYLGHGQKASVNSSSSVAILTGRGHPHGAVARYNRNSGGNWDDATVTSQNTAGGVEAAKAEAKGTFLTPGPSTPSTGQEPGTEAPTRQRSSGWSRYFIGNSATSFAPVSSGRGPERAVSASSQTSHRPDSPVLDQAGAAGAIDPAERPRNFSRAHSVRVQHGEVSRGTLPNMDSYEGELGVAVSEDALYIEGDVSTSSISPFSQQQGFDGVTSAEDDAWSPVGREEWSSGRAPSSVYTDSAHGSMLPRDVAASFPQVPRSSAVTTFPRGGEGVVISNIGDRASMAAQQGHAHRHQSSGMSWLDIGNSREST